MVLEANLERQLPVIICRRYGYADGYFTQWHLYTIDKKPTTVTVYAMVAFALYSLNEKSFEPVRRGHIAAQLTYDWIAENEWQLGNVKLSEDGGTTQQIQSSVRTVFSFEDTKIFMSDLGNTEAMDAGIVALAKDYLRMRGLGRIPLDN